MDSTDLSILQILQTSSGGGSGRPVGFGRKRWGPTIKSRRYDPRDDTRALQSLLANQLKLLPGVMRTETIIVLDTAKETTELALRSVLSSENDGDAR